MCRCVDTNCAALISIQQHSWKVQQPFFFFALQPFDIINGQSYCKEKQTKASYVSYHSIQAIRYVTFKINLELDRSTGKQHSRESFRAIRVAAESTYNIEVLRSIQQQQSSSIDNPDTRRRWRNVRPNNLQLLSAIS